MERKYLGVNPYKCQIRSNMFSEFRYVHTIVMNLKLEVYFRKSVVILLSWGSEQLSVMAMWLETLRKCRVPFSSLESYRLS